MHKRITLSGVSLRGKNRIKEAFHIFGTREWRILERQDRVMNPMPKGRGL